MKPKQTILNTMKKFKPNKGMKKGQFTFALTEDLILKVTNRLFTIGQYFELKPEELLIVLMAIVERMQKQLGITNLTYVKPPPQDSSDEVVRGEGDE